MKKQDFQKLKTKPREDLELELRKLRDRLLQLRFDMAGGKVKNIKEIHATKKSIAQILTLLRRFM